MHRRRAGEQQRARRTLDGVVLMIEVASSCSAAPRAALASGGCACAAAPAQRCNLLNLRAGESSGGRPDQWEQGGRGGAPRRAATAPPRC